MKQMIKIRFKQMIAITLATVMLFGECVTGYAAKSEEESSLPYDIVMTEDMKKDFLQTPVVTPEEQADVHYEAEDVMMEIAQGEENPAWKEPFTWNTRPLLDSRVIDYKPIVALEKDANENDIPYYVGWNITKLVKEHYVEQKTNANVITTFAMEGYGGSSMNNTNCAKAVLELKETTAYPVLQIMYCDTKGGFNVF